MSVPGRGSRGGSVDRGRGRGRGSYHHTTLTNYQRSTSLYEEDGRGVNVRVRLAHERQDYFAMVSI